MKIYVLHGWSISADNQVKWQPFLDALIQRGLDVQFLPIPGLSFEIDRAWDMADYQFWLKTQIESNQIESNQIESNQKAGGQPAERVMLIGHSFGGQLAAKFAADDHDLVAKLVLIGSSGIRDHRLMAKAKRLVFMIVAKVGKKIPLWSSAQSLAVARKVVYKLAREKDYLTAPMVMRQTMTKMIGYELWADLPKISVPTLLIWGQHDRTVPVQIAHIFAKLIASSQLKIIQDARHSPQFTHPEEVALQIVKFVAKESS